MGWLHDRWYSVVPELISCRYRIVILSNQKGITLNPDAKTPKANQSRISEFKNKVSSVFSQLDLPLSVYAATESDVFRKPRPGMWKEMVEDYDINDADGVDLQNSFFVGDAGGRIANGGFLKDFSCSDRDFADNIGIKFYTPEEYFLNQPSRSFRRNFDPKTYIYNIGQTTAGRFT